MHSEAANRDGGWIEVTTLEQAKTLDGKMVEIDSARVNPVWDVPRLHGQIKRCHWNGLALRAGAHGPTLWWVGRNVNMLRLRVVEEPSAVGVAGGTAVTALGFTAPQRASQVDDLRDGTVVELWTTDDVERVLGCAVEVVVDSDGQCPADRGIEIGHVGRVSGVGRSRKFVELDRGGVYAWSLPVHVRIDDVPIEGRTEPAPGYTVRQHPSLGWVYEGKRNGWINGGRSCEETIAETWSHRDFDAKGAEWKRAEAAGLTRGWMTVSTWEQAKALDGMMVEVDARQASDYGAVREVHGLYVKAEYQPLYRPELTTRDGQILLWLDGEQNGVRLRVVDVPDFPAKQGPNQNVLSAAAKCPTCMGAKVLKHIVPGIPDEPCPDCPPVPMQGPSEWTLMNTEVLCDGLTDGVELRRVWFQRLDNKVAFRVKVYSSGSEQRRTCVYADNGCKRVFVIERESCHKMAIARLLCWLRDGSIKP